MPNEARRAIDQLSEALVGLLWRQWAALGQAAARPPRCIVDIEGLLLASEWFAADEARLTSASATWRGTWDSLVSTQRLRNLAARTAEILPSPAWMDETPPVKAGTTASPRGRRSRRSTPVDGTSRGIPALQLRLRLLLGVGAKADCMTLLLGRPFDDALPDWCLEQETAYGPHALRKVTRDLAWASVLASSRNGQHGVLAPDAWWQAMQLRRPDRQPVWQSWGVIFAWAAAARVLIARAIDREVTAYALGAQLDKLTESLGEPLPWMAPLTAIPARRVTGIEGFRGRCEELARVVGNDG